MQDSMDVPFKVYTFWNEGDKPEVRRFNVFKGSCESFFFLSQKLLEVYPGLKDKNYTVAWRDEDGDDVVISTDLELMTALRFVNYESMKIYVFVKDAPKENPNVFFDINAMPHIPTAMPECPFKLPTGIPNVPGLHLGVVCDNCDKPVVGFRYKCTVCDDFDLCAQCESAGMHPEHCMVRVPSPAMPRALLRAAIKRSRHFLKTVTTAAEECHNKRRRDRSAERKHRHHGSQGGHGHGNHGGEHPRRPRSSWLDTFATYMNEFANLAGDIDLSEDKSKAPENKPQEQKPQEQKPQETSEKPKTETETQTTPQPETPKPGPSSAGHVPQPNTAQCPFTPRNVVHFQDILQMFMHELQPVSTSHSVASDVEVGQGDRADADVTAKPEEPVKPDTLPKSDASNASSITSDFYKDASPDKADDWTVINKEKDLMDATASAPTEPAAPIGFNLPAEFQERVKITEGGNLYPPLHPSTAVLNPKVPEARPAPAAVPKPTATVAAAATAAPKPQQPTAPVQTPQQPAQPQPRPRHPKPHIEAAIGQMLAMGFTNDGGWLTQLLESKDGNIAAVLDLLTPVNPKK